MRAGVGRANFIRRNLAVGIPVHTHHPLGVMLRKFLNTRLVITIGISSGEVFPRHGFLSALMHGHELFDTDNTVSIRINVTGVVKRTLGEFGGADAAVTIGVHLVDHRGHVRFWTAMRRAVRALAALRLGRCRTGCEQQSCAY